MYGSTANRDTGPPKADQQQQQQQPEVIVQPADQQQQQQQQPEPNDQPADQQQQQQLEQQLIMQQQQQQQQQQLPENNFTKDLKDVLKHRKLEALFYFLCCLSGQMLIFACICNPTNVHNKKYSICHKIASGLSWFLCFLFLSVNMGSLAFNMYVIAYCPYKNCTYFCTKYRKSHDLFDAYFIRSQLSVEDMENELTDVDMELRAGIQPESDFQYNNWNKLLITTATVSGFLSYYMMVFFVLIPVYSNMCHLDKCIKQPKIKKCLKLICTCWHSAFRRNYDKVISPFLDKTNDDQSSELSTDQKIFFLSFYSFNLLFWIASFVVFIKLIMLPQLQNRVEPQKDINESGLLCQFLSQFCAIQSCFIFSKVAYGVSNKCGMLIKQIKSIDVSDKGIQDYLYYQVIPYTNPQNDDDNIDDREEHEELHEEIGYILHQEDVLKYNKKIFQDWPQNRRLTLKAEEYTDKARFHLLKKIDENFNSECVASIAPYNHWFAVHWFLYSLTSFMAMAFLTETYIRYLYRDDAQDTKWWKNVHVHAKEWYRFLYIVLFCITHVFLFIYPCFRAAWLTSSRARVIKKFINHEWLYLSPSLQSAFYNYMKAQESGFKISVFCSEITFGFNLAFISVFIGMFGIIIKLSL